jgi:hypothetical protein
MQFGILLSLLFIFLPKATFASTLEEQIISLNKDIAVYSIAIDKAIKEQNPQVFVGTEFKRIEVAKKEVVLLETELANLRLQIAGDSSTPTLFEIANLQKLIQELREGIAKHVNDSTSVQQELQIEGHSFYGTPRAELSTEEANSVAAIKVSEKILANLIDHVYYRIVALKKSAAGNENRLRLIESLQHLYNVVLIQAWLPHFQKYANEAQIRNLGYDSAPTAGGQGFVSLLRMLTKSTAANDYYVASIIDGQKVREMFFVEFEYNNATDDFDAATRSHDILKNYNPLARRANAHQTIGLVTYESNYQPIFRNGNEESLFYIQLINNIPFEKNLNDADILNLVNKFKKNRFDSLASREMASIEGVIESNPGVYRIVTTSCQALFAP